MPEQTPSILLVHGAFAESTSWNPVIERLHHHDTLLVAAHSRRFVDVVAVANPLRSVAGDAAYLRDVITGVGTPVILVGHSYAGMVISEAAAGNDAVVGLVYVCAFAPEHGESAVQLSTMFAGSSLAEALITRRLSTGGNEFSIRQEVFHQQFAADLSKTQAALMGATQRPVTEGALTEGLPCEVPAWKHVPSWFVFGDHDRNIPAAAHRFMAERASAKGTREVAGASHAISVSNPDAVTATIFDALDALVPAHSGS